MNKFCLITEKLLILTHLVQNERKREGILDIRLHSYTFPRVSFATYNFFQTSDYINANNFNFGYSEQRIRTILFCLFILECKWF